MGEGICFGSGDRLGAGMDGGSGVTAMAVGVGGAGETREMAGRADSPLVSPTGAVESGVGISCSPSPHATDTERTKIARSEATRVQRWFFKRHSLYRLSATKRSS